MDQQLIDLYHRHVGMAFDRQQRLADFLALKANGQRGKHDSERALLSFGSRFEFESPILGSHTTHNNSWLWAWSNRNIKLASPA